MRAFAIARRSLVVLAAVCMLLGVAACGDSDDSGSNSGASTTQSNAAPKTETLKVALYPSTDYAALYAGIKAGVFEKHAIKLDIEQVLTGTGLTAAITSGKADVGTNSPTSMSTGISNGLPVKMVSVADTIPTEGYVEVLVKKDSDIKSFGDLAGKQVATINLQGLFHLGVLNAVKKAGGDPKSVKALAMAPTDEPQALSAGRVDAIVLQDPFVATAKKNPKFRSLGNPFAELDYKIPAGGLLLVEQGRRREVPGPAALQGGAGRGEQDDAGRPRARAGGDPDLHRAQGRRGGRDRPADLRDRVPRVGARPDARPDEGVRLAEEAAHAG